MIEDPEIRLWGEVINLAIKDLRNPKYNREVKIFLKSKWFKHICSMCGSDWRDISTKIKKEYP